MKSRILYTKPSITELETRYAADAAAHGWGERCYEYLTRFEKGFAAHLGVTHAIATSSCTGALHLGMAGLGIGAGDEVILADTNWIASAAPIVHLGATPVFVDVLPDSWCIDPACVERAITPRTKAILAVHLYGNVCDLDALLDIGRRHGLPVIEDAAEAIGSQHRGRRAGSIGAFGAFSFHGTKTLTTGEGGMFVTSDDALFERVLTMSNHGRARGQTRQFWPDEVGFKYKMSNIQAALGLGQLERLDELVGKKRQILEWYKERLGGVKGLQLNPQTSWSHGIAWMSSVVLDPKRHAPRLEVTRRLKAAGIDTRPFFPPLSSFPMFGGNASFSKVATHLGDHGINLPSGHNLTESDVDRVTDGLRAALRPTVRSVA